MKFVFGQCGQCGQMQSTKTEGCRLWCLPAGFAQHGSLIKKYEDGAISQQLNITEIHLKSRTQYSNIAISQQRNIAEIHLKSRTPCRIQQIICWRRQISLRIHTWRQHCQFLFEVFFTSHPHPPTHTHHGASKNNTFNSLIL